MGFIIIFPRSSSSTCWREEWRGQPSTVLPSMEDGFGLDYVKTNKV